MSNAPQPLEGRPGRRLHWLFLTDTGLRSGWRLLLFFIIFVTSLGLLQFLVIRFVPAVGALLRGVQRQQGELSPASLITLESTNLLATLAGLSVMSWIERRRLVDYGLIATSRDGGRRFCEGLLWGLAMVMALCTFLRLEGRFLFGPLALSASPAIRYGLLWALATLMVGLYEETLFRGYAQFTLASGIGFWPAAFVLSAGFGAVHLSDRGYTWLGVVTAMLFGLLFSLSLRRTGSLWLGIGFHSAFDFAETFLFSPPNGGIAQVSTHLFSSSLRGPSWLTGGGTGVEGSVNGLLAFVILFLLFDRIHPARKNADAKPRHGGERAPTG